MVWCCSVGEGVSPIEANHRSVVLTVPGTYAVEIWTLRVGPVCLFLRLYESMTLRDIQCVSRDAAREPEYDFNVSQ